ncbi:MAG: hypothetical protein WDO13_13380 [Verrucomicrobiota bacterium]
MELDIEPHLPLARRLAREFSNIPGLSLGEIEITAQEALARALRQHDASKGEFPPYAAQAIRNALKSLYDQQVRHHRHHHYILDEVAPSDGNSTQAPRVQNLKDNGNPSVPQQARFNESKALLDKLLGGLSPRHRSVLEGVRDGGATAKSEQKWAYPNRWSRKSSIRPWMPSGRSWRKTVFAGLIRRAFWSPFAPKQSRTVIHQSEVDDFLANS